MCLKKEDLDQFIGTNNYYQHWTRKLIYTDGVKFLAEKGKAFWLIDVVASYQDDKRITSNPMLCDMQFWRLSVADGRGVLTCVEDSGQTPIIKQEIEFTDFPLDEVEIWVERGSLDGENIFMVAMLPGER